MGIEDIKSLTKRVLQSGSKMQETFEIGNEIKVKRIKTIYDTIIVASAVKVSSPLSFIAHKKTISP